MIVCLILPAEVRWQRVRKECDKAQTKIAEFLTFFPFLSTSEFIHLLVLTGGMQRLTYIILVKINMIALYLIS